MSRSGKPYGTEYKTVYQSGNIKFVKVNSGNTTPPMETMTKGRIYVTVNNKDQIKSITYYDKNNKRYKQIDIDHNHNINGNPENPHIHKGYEHDENGTFTLSTKEGKLLDKVLKAWYNKDNK